MPGINDSPAQVNEILERCGEAGASSVTGIALHLRGEVREIFLDWLRQYRPELVPRYEELYASGGTMAATERRRLARLVSSGRRARPRRPEGARPEPGTAQRPREAGRQASLF
jgi:DNA repair photolyase